MLPNQAEIRVYSGLCPDGECRTKLFFPSYAASSIECTGCGKHYNKDLLHQVQLVNDQYQTNEAIRNILRSVLLSKSGLKKGTDLVKVKGYSNYHCRLISPLLTRYGMDKKTSEAKLLREMGQGEVFDCFHVGDRAFAIEGEYLDTPGYGRDKSGSMTYLHEITEAVKVLNENEERLVPLHVDGDGHCLVHAISRALVGREIFWHPLMVNLQNHLLTNLNDYKYLFKDFIGQDEWDLIISEAGPDFQPEDDQPLGLRNIHIFGLANVLRRPILLLDSISGLQSSADYSGTFLPALLHVDQCKKNDKLIPPLAIAWSNSGRNHYIPLVNIRNKPLTKLPSAIIPKAWGTPDEQINMYIDFDSNGLCTIGGSRAIGDTYLHRLMKAMDDKFLELNGVSASLVTEVHQFIFKPSGVVGVRPQAVIEKTQQTVQDQSLMRCIACHSVSEYECPANQEWLAPGGKMYTSAYQVEGGLAGGQLYSFPEHQLICTYDSERDILKPYKFKDVDVTICGLCNGALRTVKADGSPVYLNGDRTTNPSSGKTKCRCGFKHYWDGKEYDNQPEAFPVALEWGGKSIKETVYWFQHEGDESLNSNVYAVAGKLVQKYFPGEFGSEILVQKVVDIILRQTASKEGENKGARPDIPNLPPSPSPSQPEGPAVGHFIPSKIILTGQKKKTFHKEELTQSEAEKRVKIKTEHHAAITQHRQTKLQKSPEKSPPKQQNNKPTTTSLPTSTSPRLPRTDKKIRLTSTAGGQHDLTLPLNVTFSQLQDAIHRELEIPPADQKIRYGFPPLLLHPPEEGKQDEPVPIQHGDRVTVEVLPPPEPVPQPQVDVEMPEDVAGAVAGAVGGEGEDVPAKQDDTAMDVDYDPASAFASILLSALSANDLWDTTCSSPHLFEKGGYYYELVKTDLGPLVDDQHFAIPHLPNKVFAYNQEKDHIELCLGKEHIPIQPVNQETLSLAHTQQLTPRTSTSQNFTSVMNTEASFSGVISKNSGRTQKAFSGEGRSLSGSSPVLPRQPAEPHQIPSLPNERISEAFKTLTTITSDAQGHVSSTTTNPSPVEQSTTEEKCHTDEKPEHSSMVGEHKETDKSAEEPSMGEESKQADKPIQDMSIVGENNQSENAADEPVMEQEVKESEKAANESSIGEEDNQRDKPTEELPMLEEASQTEKPANKSSLEEVNTQTPYPIDHEEPCAGGYPSQPDKPQDVPSVIEGPFNTDSLVSSISAAPDVDMTNEKPSDFVGKEADVIGVVMETDHDGNDSSIEDRKCCEDTKGIRCSLDVSVDTDEAKRMSSEGEMDIDHPDQMQSHTALQTTSNIPSLDSSQNENVLKEQEANTGNPTPNKSESNGDSCLKESKCFDEEKKEIS